MPFSPLSSLLFLFIYLGILTTETHSQITPSTSQYQGSPSFQDLIYDYGNIEFKFEEDLVLKDLVECTNDRVEATCAPCDYINFVDEDGTCVNPNVDIESTGVDCPCDATLCSSKVLELKAGKPQVFTSIGYLETSMRYNHDNRDIGFSVRMKVLNGTSDFSYSLGIGASSLNVFYSTVIAYSISAHQDLYICPSDPRFADTLTYFIGVFSPNLGARTRFEVEIILINETFSPSPFISEIELDEIQNGTCISTDYDIQNSSFFFQDDTETLFEDCRGLILVFPLKDSSCRTISILAERFQFDFVEVLAVGLIPRSTLDELPLSETVEFSVLNYQATPLYFQSGDNVFSVCPDSPSNPSDTVLIIQLLAHLTAEIKLFIRDVTDNPEVRSRPIGTLTPLNFQGYLFDSIALSCPCYPTDNCSDFVPVWPGWDKLVNPALLTNETSPDFARYFSLNGDQITFRSLSALEWDWPARSGLVVRVIPVLDSPFNPLIYPMPEIASDLNVFPFSSNYMAETDPIVNDTIGFLIQLRSFKDTTSTVLAQDRYELCSVRFVTPNRLHGSITGEPPSSEPFMINEIEEMSTECQGSQYSEVVDSVGTLFSRMIDFSLFANRSTFFYSISALVATRPYLNCMSKILPFFEATSIEVNNSLLCFEYDPNDPCCNSTLGWTDCCLPDGRIQETNSLPVKVNETHEKLFCDDECATDVLSYLSETLALLGAQKPCEQINEYESTTFSAKHCSNQWLGDTELGYPCDSDLVCQQHFGQGECDISAGRCINVREVMEEKFVLCLLEQINSVARTALLFLFDITEGNIFESLTSPNQTVSDYGPMSVCKDSLMSSQISDFFSSCPGCQVNCLLESVCEIPFQCFDAGPTCNIAFVINNPGCQGDKICNWNISATEEECKVGESMCMHCYNSSHCKANLSFNQTECESISVCVLSNDVIFNITQEECENMVITENITGYCDDIDFIRSTILEVNATLPFQEEGFVETLRGACIFPLSPNNLPLCPFVRNGLYSLDFSTRRGCVVFADCTFNGTKMGLPIACEHFLTSEDECTNEGGKWLSLPIPSELQCHDTEQLYCIDPTESNALRLPRPREKEPDSNVEPCKDCFQIKSEPAIWIRERSFSRFKYTEPIWKKAEMVTPYHTNVTSLDFRAVDTLLNLLDNTVASLSYASSVRCYYLFAMEPATYIVDNCVSDDGVTPNNTEEIFLGLFDPDNNASEPVSFGEVYWCPGTSFQVILSNGELVLRALPPSNLTTPQTSLFCGNSTLYMTWQSQFIGNRTIEPLSLFGNSNLLDPDPVRNDVGASVGIVVSDGFFFENRFIPEGSYYWGEVIVDIRPEHYDPRYTVYDFGSMVPEEKRYRRNELELRPMNISALTVSTNAINQTVVSGLIVQNLVSDETTSRTFLILRLPNYSEEGVDELLSDGEETMLYVFCGLYGLSFLFVFGVFLIITFLNFSSSNFLMMGLGSGMMCLRSIYVGVYAAGYLQGNSIGAILMVETPSFLYLALGGLVVMIFTFTYQNLSTGGTDGAGIDKKPYWIKYAVFIGMLIVVFVIIAVLMVELPEESNTQYSCFGWNAEENPSDTVENIRIAYHSLALFLASICAGRLFFLSNMLQTKVFESKRVTLFASGIGAGVLCQNIMWVVYSAVRKPSPYVVIPMFILEAIPVIFVAFLVVPKKNLRRLYMIRKTSSSMTPD